MAKFKYLFKTDHWALLLLLVYIGPPFIIKPVCIFMHRIKHAHTDTRLVCDVQLNRRSNLNSWQQTFLSIPTAFTETNT